MVQRKKNLPDKLLTGVELELMTVIWQLGECTVREVQDALPKERALAYTSVATMMKILEQKGILSSQRGERAQTYRARVAKADYEAKSLRHLTQDLFQGDRSSLVMRLLDDNGLTEDELKAIRKLVDERLKKS